MIDCEGRSSKLSICDISDADWVDITTEFVDQISIRICCGNRVTTTERSCMGWWTINSCYVYVDGGARRDRRGSVKGESNEIARWGIDAANSVKRRDVIERYCARK